MFALLTQAGLLLASLTPAGTASAVLARAEEGPDLGGTLSVNGVEIPENEIKRFLIYGPCRPVLEYSRINALVQWELGLRSAEGQDMSRYEISDEAFQKHYDKKINEFVEKFPMLDVQTEVRRAYRSVDWYKQELRQEMIFDEVFVPDNPELWPDLTFEALRQEAGDILINDFKESYERRLKFTEDARAEWQAKKDAGEDPGPYPDMYPEDSMYRSILRQIVRDAYYAIVGNSRNFSQHHVELTMGARGAAFLGQVMLTGELALTKSLNRYYVARNDPSNLRLEVGALLLP